MTTPITPAPGDNSRDAAVLAPRARIWPSRVWYVVPLLALLSGVAWAVWAGFGLASVGSHIDSFPRVPIPAGGQVSLNHPGGYVVYYEGPGAQSGQIPAFRVLVTPASASAAVKTMAPYHGSLTYDIGSHHGRAVLTLQVTRPGQFTVAAHGRTGLPAGGDLAFGDSFAHGLVTGIVGIVGSVLLVMAGLAGLIVIFVIRFVKTRRAGSPASATPPASAPPSGSGWSPPGTRP